MINGTQMKLEDVSDEYKQFTDKFKPKKTTDDCYTPTNIYKAVLDWVADEYDIDPNNIVRPFWPGGGIMNENTIQRDALLLIIRPFQSFRRYAVGLWKTT